ncbi:MAG: hypothetical protein ACFCUX_07560, partial [Candidatus Methylacidiphilales bacterium]
PFIQRPADVLTLLLEHGADINHQGINRTNALSNALSKYLPETPRASDVASSDPMVAFLLEHGAQAEDPLNLTRDDDTPSEMPAHDSTDHSNHPQRK